MKLSSDSSRIAVFDTQIPHRSNSGGYTIYDKAYYYKIGDFEYKVAFYVRHNGGYGVAFSINRALGDTLEERAQAWSRILKEEVDLEEASYYDDPMGIPYDLKYGVSGTGNAYKVFAAVLSAIQDFRKSHPDVYCFHFSADREHQSLYRTLLKRYKAHLSEVNEEQNPRSPSEVLFDICFNENI